MSDNSSYYTSAEKNSPLAVITLIAGILGITLFPLIGSVVAVVVGPMAKREIDESGGMLGGQNIAQIGIILGWVGLALTFIGCCMAIGVIGCSLSTILFSLGMRDISLSLPFLFIAVSI
jgi:hypothetical protein